MLLSEQEDLPHTHKCEDAEDKRYDFTYYTACMLYTT